MSLFLESIKYSNGQFFRMNYHEKRFNGVRKIKFKEPKISLQEQIIVPDGLGDSTYKVRVVYDAQVQKVEFVPYELKTIQTLKVVHENQIDYSFKAVDREQLNNLFDQRADCDDVLIVRNKKITDTSYCNVALFDGSNWYTPKSPLLRGTQRAFLIDFGLIIQEEIRLRDLKYFKKIRLFNSMIEWTDCMDVKLRNVIS
ncbi:MAG: aminotransferase class IV [Bacteroidales bacterium]